MQVHEFYLFLSLVLKNTWKSIWLSRCGSEDCQIKQFHISRRRVSLLNWYIFLFGLLWQS